MNLNGLTAGTYTVSVTIGGDTTQTTGGLAYNATSGTVAAAINALSNVVSAAGSVFVGRHQIVEAPALYAPYGLPA